jgi:hypothetical protein
MSSSSVHDVRTEFKTSGGMRTSGNKHQHKQGVDKYDVKTTVQRKAHGFVFKNEPPTMDIVTVCDLR